MGCDPTRASQLRKRTAGGQEPGAAFWVAAQTAAGPVPMQCRGGRVKRKRKTASAGRLATSSTRLHTRQRTQEGASTWTGRRMCAGAGQHRRAKGAATPHMRKHHCHRDCCVEDNPGRNIQLCKRTARVGRFARCKCGVPMGKSKLESPATMLCTKKTLYNACCGPVGHKNGCTCCRQRPPCGAHHTHTHVVLPTYTPRQQRQSVQTLQAVKSYTHRRSQRPTGAVKDRSKASPTARCHFRGVSAGPASDRRWLMRAHNAACAVVCSMPCSTCSSECQCTADVCVRAHV